MARIAKKLEYFLEEVIKMYISEFACGVFATLITEIVLIIGYAIYARKKK